jgi:hypothetical protein
MEMERSFISTDLTNPVKVLSLLLNIDKLEIYDSITSQIKDSYDQLFRLLNYLISVIKTYSF